MNCNWRVEFLLQAARRPEQRDAWLQLAAEWIVKAHLERKLGAVSSESSEIGEVTLVL